MSDPRALLFALDERPPPGKSLTAAVAHLLAIVGGIATAPLIIARGLNLDVGQTTYLGAAAFTVSGIATFVQVYRFGHLGSGLLSVQGTSFAFVGVFIYAGLQLQADHTNAEVVGILLGTSAVGGVFTMATSFFLQRLGTIITLNVAGIVIFLLGLSLVQVAFTNLNVAASQASGTQSWMVWVQAAVVIACIAFLSSRNNPWVKLSSICVGLMLGVAFAFATGGLDRSLPELTGGVALLQLAPFPLGFDPIVFLLLLPIFLVTITESIGDLTATSLLSGCSVQGDSYWQRIRGGVMADGFNTTLAAMFGTFPNTTFSQNNGVIRLTGVASRYVGMILAGLLVLLGSVPLVSAVFQVLPGGVLHGSTGLMFAMIMFAGIRILRAQPDRRRTMTMLVICTAGALALTQSGRISVAAGVNLPDYVLILTNFPVATGAVLAMLWELLAPARAQPAELS
jgi:NCS2 family nucleobase:cation symporter-2/xanthine permease XanP